MSFTHLRGSSRGVLREAIGCTVSASILDRVGLSGVLFTPSLQL